MSPARTASAISCRRRLTRRIPRPRTRKIRPSGPAPRHVHLWRMIVATIATKPSTIVTRIISRTKSRTRNSTPISRNGTTRPGDLRPPPQRGRGADGRPCPTVATCDVGIARRIQRHLGGRQLCGSKDSCPALSGGYQSPRIPRRSSRSSLSSSDSGGVYTVLLLGRNKPRTKRLADTRNLGMGSTVPMDRIVGKQAVDLRSRTGRHP